MVVTYKQIAVTFLNIAMRSYVWIVAAKFVSDAFCFGVDVHSATILTLIDSHVTFLTPHPRFCDNKQPKSIKANDLDLVSVIFFLFLLYVIGSDDDVRLSYRRPSDGPVHSADRLRH